MHLPRKIQQVLLTGSIILFPITNSALALTVTKIERTKSTDDVYYYESGENCSSPKSKEKVYQSKRKVSEGMVLGRNHGLCLSTGVKSVIIKCTKSPTQPKTFIVKDIALSTWCSHDANINLGIK